ncbi:hypothetical protein [Bradyrhizobium sp. BR 1432]|uniref:hypothetical protein n=1 Tax=Bradyrhizobium sp. BR 1432 TaxID=3447966 RepID=UPI003EE77516
MAITSGAAKLSGVKYIRPRKNEGSMNQLRMPRRLAAWKLAMTDRKPPSSWTSSARRPCASSRFEHCLHGVGIDHETPAQRRRIADAEGETLVAEQEIGPVESVKGDAGVERLAIVGRGAGLETLAIHVRDRHAFGNRHLGAAIVEGKQLDVMSR